MALARILIVHNRYRLPGGEDVVAESQRRLLREHGHVVRFFERDNREINSYSFLDKAQLFFRTAHNPDTARQIRDIVAELRPDVAYVHNTLPLISPSIYRPLHDAGVKVVQWLHNYRLVCPAGTLFRAGAPCTLCESDLRHSIRYGCWSDSKLATRAVVRMLKRRRRDRTWTRKVDLFVALNSFQKEILVRSGGVPAERVIVQPNFSDIAPAEKPQAPAPDAPFVFIGRLTVEKGVLTLLKALPNLRDVPIVILGGGPLSSTVANACANSAHTFLGQVSREEVAEILRGARALLFTSEWPEGCPSVILEALALGKPVIASSVAGARELLSEGRTGLFFPPGDADALAACVRQLLADPALGERMGSAALQHFRERHTRDAGYKMLQGIHERLGITSSVAAPALRS